VGMEVEGEGVGWEEVGREVEGSEEVGEGTADVEVEAGEVAGSSRRRCLPANTKPVCHVSLLFLERGSTDSLASLTQNCVSILDILLSSRPA
jgi:hypothetical protein